ncbi:nickel/cobalt efflux protein RcnA [mine drainage metagenome]|uniref:Nickel/cobalt efflux protein RcnA n=1 Tax=mine drainage metagenome TaxID=410659 RepID=A0A1J5PZL8_9ZZZZ
MTRFFRTALLLAVLLITLAPFARPAQADDYFGRPEVAAGAPAVAAPTPIESRIVLPQPFRAILGAAISFQATLNARLRANLDQVATGSRLAPDLAIIFASFLYGMLHAIGPGHGKVVVASYLTTRRTRFTHALSMSGVVAATQALSAIVLVAVFAVLFGSTGKAILDRAGTIEIASYGALIVMGLWMAWQAVKPGPRVCGCGHDHGHGHHDHGHHDHHGHDHVNDRKSLMQLFATGSLAGLRPCSGAILVLLFTLANGIFFVGLLSTLAMGLGVALTVAAVSVGAVGLNRAVAGRGGRWSDMLGRAGALAGALVIITFGSAAIYAISTGMVAPLVG